MAITDPITQVTMPQALEAAMRMRVGTQQAGLVQQEAARQQQLAEQAAIATRIQQARLPIMLNAYKQAATGLPGNPAGPTTPGGMPMQGAPPTPDAQPTPAGAAAAAANQSGAAPPDTNPLDATTAGPGGSATPWYNQSAIDAALRSRFFVNQAGTPQENQALYNAKLTNDPGLIGAATMRLQQGIKRRTAQSQYDSTNLYDALDTVVSAKPGSALAQLEAVAPAVAKRLQMQVKDPAKQDAEARAFAEYISGEVHQYTGRPVVQRPDGYYVDKVTGRVVPGVGRSGLSMAQWESLAQEGLAPTPVPQSNGTTRMVPRWQSPGQNAPNLESWILNMARGAGAWGAQPGVSGGPRADAQSNASQAATTVQQRAAQAATAPQVAADPTLRKALQDPTFNLQQSPAVFGTSITPEAQGIQSAQAASAAKLAQDAKLTTEAAQQAQTYLQAAKRIMMARGAPVVGLYGDVLSEINRIAPHGVDAANYQMVAKFLSQAAVQNTKQIYGSNPTENEVQLQLHQLNPSTSMQYGAVMDLLNENLRNTQYALSSAGRIPVYLAHGKNPMWFPEWNAKYWPQAKAVNKGLAPVGSTPSNAAATAPAPQWALLKLRQHPELAPEFEAQFHYLPSWAKQ